MVARLDKQDDTLRKEFLKRIQAKIAAEKDAMKEKIKGEVPSLLAKVINPVLGVAFDYYRSIDKAKGDFGESNVGAKLRLGLSNKWILMNDIIVEPEPETFAQIDHVLIGPPGLFIIETKAWQGAYVGFKDRWKRKEGNKWLPCDSPTIQNLRHVRLIRKWLEETGMIKINLPADKWIMPIVVFTNASWLKTNECSMPIFDGALKLLDHLKGQESIFLNDRQIDSISNLLSYPRLAKAYINNEINVIDYEKESRHMNNDTSSEKPLPIVEERQSKNGKKFVRITGDNRQAENTRDAYIKKGQKVGPLNKDKFKEGVFFFYLNV